MYGVCRKGAIFVRFSQASDWPAACLFQSGKWEKCCLFTGLWVKVIVQTIPESDRPQKKTKKTILSYPENIYEHLVSLPTWTSFLVISWFSKNFAHWNEPNKCPAKENLVSWRRAKEVLRREIKILSMHVGTSKTDFVARTAFQLILSSRGSPRLRANFFVIFNLILMCHLSGQEAFSFESLTRYPSLIWNTAGTEGSVEPNCVLRSSAFLWPGGN